MKLKKPFARAVLAFWRRPLRKQKKSVNDVSMPREIFRRLAPRVPRGALTSNSFH